MSRSFAVIVGTLSFAAFIGPGQAQSTNAPPNCGLSPEIPLPASAATSGSLESAATAESLYRKGVAAAQGVGDAADCTKAFALLQKAASEGYAPAENSLGELYLAGQGVAPNPKEAAKWFNVAATKGEARGQYNLGMAIAQGRSYGYGSPGGTGSAADHGGFAGSDVLHGTSSETLRRAAALWQAAAGKGDPFAKYQLAGMYATGQGGMPHDVNKAIELYKEAADANVPGASERLDALRNAS
jgi:hypothetical protein